MPPTWRQSLQTLLGVIDDLDAQLRPLEQELRPHARQDPRVQLLMTIPGIAEILGLTLASEIGDIAKFPTARQLVGFRLLRADPNDHAIRHQQPHRPHL